MSLRITRGDTKSNQAMAIAVLLRNFDIEAVTTPGGGQAKEHLAFTMQPVGLRMRLRPLAGHDAVAERSDAA